MSLMGLTTKKPAVSTQIKLDSETGVVCFPGTGNLGGEHGHNDSVASPGCRTMSILWTLIPPGRRPRGIRIKFDDDQ